MFAIQEWDAQDYYRFWVGDIKFDPARYVTPLKNENQEEYQFRLRNARYDNWAAKAINIYTAYVLEGKQVDYDQKHSRYKICDIAKVAKAEIQHKMVGGWCYLVAQPQIGVKVYSCLQVAEERKGDIIVYRFHDNAPSQRMGFSSGIRFVIELPRLGGDGIIYEVNSAGQQVNEQPFREDQLAVVELNDQRQSILAPVFDRLVNIFNMKTHTDLAWRKAASLVTMAPTDEAIKAGSQYQQMQEGVKIEVVHMADPAKIKLIEEQIKNEIKDCGSILGLQSEFSDILGINQSGISKIVDMLDEKAIVSEIASTSNDGLNKVFRAWHEIDNIPGDPDQINLTGDFRPMGEELSFAAIKELAAFINTDLGYKVCQKAAVRVNQKLFTDAEAELMEADIEANGRKPYNELLDIGGALALGGDLPEPPAPRQTEETE